ncbi:MAG: hypothetical protein JWP57_4285 [Spirosoma sp.]|nr:hypothetical protein [Spirosoma sp.]
METLFLDSPLIKADDEMALESDLAIRHAAERYLETLRKVDELKGEAEERLFSGSPGSIYLKRLGHRSLTVEEKEGIIEAKGTEEDKQSIISFREAQINLNNRLKPLSQFISLVHDQAGLPRGTYYRRLKRPGLWTADEIIRVLDVLARIQI